MTLQLESIKSEKQDREQSSVAIYRIISYPADYTLQGLHLKWAVEEKEREIIIPRFQRQFVWTHTKASQLIESFLLGLPVPSIFLYKEKSQKFLVIDGQQRLRTVFSFFEGVLPNGDPFFLKDVAPRWAGKYYRDLDETDGRRLRDSVLRAVLVEQVDPEDDTSLYQIFYRLNTGGTALTAQEVRNCIFHGPFNDFIVTLNLSGVWRQIVGAPQPDSRMRDVELMLRFFSLLADDEHYTKPMKDFMSNFMKKRQLLTNNQALKATFNTVTKRIVETLGPKPFHVKRGLNAAVYDSVMLAFARNSSTPANLAARYKELLVNPAFSGAVSAGTTDVDTVKARISLAQQVLFA